VDRSQVGAVIGAAAGYGDDVVDAVRAGLTAQVADALVAAEDFCSNGPPRPARSLLASLRALPRLGVFEAVSA